MDLDDLRLTPIYRVLGSDGVLVDRIGNQVGLRVIDKTSGINIGDGVTVNSIEPVADVRMTELAENGLDTADIDGCELVLNGNSWTIRTHALRPGIAGEANGEIRLILSEA